MIDAVFGEGGLLSRAVPGYEWRPQQLAMAQVVARAIAEDRPAVVEAGTGTGKTLAYLVPAILSGRKVVISTGTKTLQEQLYRRDVPLLQRVLPGPFTAATMKGIGNYLCLRRFAEADLPEVEGERLRTWARATESGDRAELADLPDDSALWARIQSTPETRLGARCRHFEDCFVTRMRREAAAANLVIVNHHLFFADLALRAAWPQAQVLPPYEAVIFDEAHGLEEIATEYFGLQVSSHRLGVLARDVVRRDPELAALAARVAGAAETMFARLARKLGPQARARTTGELWTGEALSDYHALDNALDEAAARCGRDPDEETAALGRRAQAIRDELALLVEQRDRGLVYWAETRGRGVFLHASPVDVGPRLRETIVSAGLPIVFTSATLSVDASFDYFRERVGLDAADDAACVALTSPFDYAKQALLYLPDDLPDPQAPGFAEACADRMADLLAVTDGRAFLLFTSHRNLRSALRRLRERAVPWPLLVQGDRPRTTLLEVFRRDVGSVLLATSSFWEGVDVVGEALSLVVIDKLPFAPPDDPIGAARIDLLRERGRDPFRSYQLPRAALALKQGFGRLIRHKSDRGIVGVLDRRMRTRGYGRLLERSLPEGCRRTGDLSEVRSWWRPS